jgi:DNA polymerase-3 subunit delta'
VERFADVLGQRAALERLARPLAADRLHHALLFVGPEGVGKYGAARLLAKRLFCAAHAPAEDTGPSLFGAALAPPPRPADPLEPCGRCAGCVKVATTGHPDLSVFDTTEKQLKLDALRELIAQLHLRPIEARRRVLVVRDADRMNPATQNALLKTLEEPPGGAQLVLTTARPRALLPTVLSRCFRVPFLPVPDAELAALVAARRGLDPALATLVAALAQGAPGRALEADADALRAQRDRAAEVDRVLDPRGPRALVDALRTAQGLAEDADGLRAVLDLLGVWLRDQLVVESQGADGTIANVDRRDELVALAAERGAGEILRRARALEHWRGALFGPYNLNATMTLERLCLALVALGRTPAAGAG